MPVAEDAEAAELIDPDIAVIGALLTQWEGRTVAAGSGLQQMHWPRAELRKAVDLGTWPEGYCLQCHGFHTCWSCHDGGFVRVTEERQDARWGKAQPCQTCAAGGVAGPRVDVARELLRMRVPRKFLGQSIESWAPEGGQPRRACISYVAIWPPSLPILFMTGGVGTGKTHLATGILRALFELHGQRGQFWATIDLLDRYKATFDADRATETVDAVDTALRRLPLLVIDDWGTEKATDWAHERLFRLVDERYRNRAPLVITTNSDMMDMPVRILSRLSDAQECTRVYFGGPDMRAVAR